jgi:iron complex transport system permease protein
VTAVASVARAADRSRARARLAWGRLQRRGGLVWGVVLGAVLVLAMLTSMGLGAVPVPLRETLSALSAPDHPFHILLWQIRVPRVLAAALVGAALGVAGSLMQTVVRNPLADPGLLGVNAGAGLAVVSTLVLAPQLATLVPVVAFLGAAAAVTVLLVAAWGPGRRLSPLKIVLSGVAVQAILFSLLALVTFFFADRAPAFAAFSVGSLHGAGWSDLRLAAPPVALGLVLSLGAVRPLNLLLLDDSTATGVGLEVQRVRALASGVAALLAASAVSIAGLVGFVGLVVPNGVRLLTGPDHRTLLPLSAVGGAVLVVVADLAARLLVAPVELPVGALLALLGGPYFLYLLWRKLP